MDQSLKIKAVKWMGLRSRNGKGNSPDEQVNIKGEGPACSTTAYSPTVRQQQDFPKPIAQSSTPPLHPRVREIWDAGLLFNKETQFLFNTTIAPKGERNLGCWITVQQGDAIPVVGKIVICTTQWRELLGTPKLPKCKPIAIGTREKGYGFESFDEKKRDKMGQTCHKCLSQTPKSKFKFHSGCHLALEGCYGSKLKDQGYEMDGFAQHQVGRANRLIGRQMSRELQTAQPRGNNKNSATSYHNHQPRH